jgi:hypothetical protein
MVAHAFQNGPFPGLSIRRSVDDAPQGVEHRGQDLGQRDGATSGTWVLGLGRPVADAAAAGGDVGSAHVAEDDRPDARQAVRPKALPNTVRHVQRAIPDVEESTEASLRLRDALTTAGLSYETAADVLGVSTSRVQAKCSPEKVSAPLTWADVLKLARAGGKAREVARILHAELGAAIEDEHVPCNPAALPLVGMQFSTSAMAVGNVLTNLMATPTEQVRRNALVAIGSAWRVLVVLHGLVGQVER